jgi:hypothetical protein
MKPIFTFFILSFFSNFLFAQNVNIPDANFKAALLAHDPVIDTNSDGEIQVSEAEAFTGTLVFENAAISDLTGLEAFINVAQIYCSQNLFISIPLSTIVNLTNLVAWDNQLEGLDVSQNPHLFRIDIGGNNVASLDVTNNPELVELSIGNNSIGNLDLSNNSLLQRFYSIYGNTHTFLDFSSNSALNQLILQNLDELQFVNIQNGNTAGITTLNLTGLPALGCVRIDSDVLGNIPESWVYDEGTNFSDSCVMGTQEISFTQPEIYPNPVQNQFNIKHSERITSVEIYSLSGEKILSKNEENIHSVNVSNLSKGIYLVKIKTISGRVFTQKLIIK